MAIRIKMIFRGLPASDTVEGYVRWRVAEIARRVRDVVRCDVLVDAADEALDDDFRFHALVRVGLRSGDAVSGGGGFSVGGRLNAASAVVDAFDLAQQALLDRDVSVRRPRVHAATTLRVIRDVG